MAATQWDPVEADIARETSRRILAVLVISTFVVSIIASYLTVWILSDGDMADRADVALRISAPVVAIVGTVLGFYFGQETNP
jgi:uncharacterized RDD family membrane protein YckC